MGNKRLRVRVPLGPNKPFPYTTNPDEIPTAKVVVAGPAGGRYPGVRYACPDSCWREHHDGWERAVKDNPAAPIPEPWGHCMFRDPVGYGMVPYGNTDPAAKRAAIETVVRSEYVNGYGLPKERIEAMIADAVQCRLNLCGG